MPQTVTFPTLLFNDRTFQDFFGELIDIFLNQVSNPFYLIIFFLILKISAEIVVKKIHFLGLSELNQKDRFLIK